MVNRCDDDIGFADSRAKNKETLRAFKDSRPLQDLKRKLESQLWAKDYAGALATKGQVQVNPEPSNMIRTLSNFAP